MSEYMNPLDAYRHYELRRESGELRTELEKALAQEGIAAIEMPLSRDDFVRFSEGFEVCLKECPELLHQTASTIDTRFGSEVGYVRKDKKINRRTGQQVGDPKNYFHFSEPIRNRWDEQFRYGPKILQDFIKDGYEIHDTLIGVAKKQIAELEPTHLNISKLYFPNDDSFSFLRLLRYDGYEPHSDLGEVAKPHYDIGGVTIQAYADAPGFWAAKDGVDGTRQHFDTHDNEAYTFLGKGHEKIYGNDMLRPLWHGVDRVIPVGVTWVPERTAVILFVDAPEVDYHIREQDTLPYLARRLGKDALEIDYRVREKDIVPDFAQQMGEKVLALV